MDNDKVMNSSYLLIDRNNPVFCSFVVWSSALIIKFLLMSTLTTFHRMRTKTAPNPEDLTIVRGQEISFGNEDVERVRRAHRNDMENILPYLSAGLLYVLTNPAPLLATILFRVATIARFVHTFVYAIYVIPQPARAIAFAIQFIITLYMAFMCIVHFI